MTSANIQVVRRWFEEVWNRGRAELIPELLAADAPIYDVGAPGEVRRGAEGFRPVYEKLRGAFPDIHFTIDEIIGDREVDVRESTPELFIDRPEPLGTA
ncbi:MAG TPA: nuclear transport factor 2 family protein, partial [Stellaceae bacterium]|nr:nuclear transport factor 2 family protein [Stellaceae bacterium]